jgi:hypothetical protein
MTSDCPLTNQSPLAMLQNQSSYDGLCDKGSDEQLCMELFM